MTTPRVDKPERIGLFGGTFDPVHYGHLRPAVEIAEHFELSTLYLVPNHKPAHRGPTVANTDSRITMLRLAIANVPQLAVDGREALRDKPSYTFDTLTEIRAERPDATLVFFLGMDAFALFDTWHNWEGILQLANLVVLKRPGAAQSDFSNQLLSRQRAANGSRIVAGNAGVIELCNVTQLAISATDVRRRIGSDLTVRFLLPQQVSEYIDAKQLYRTSQ